MSDFDEHVDRVEGTEIFVGTKTTKEIAEFIAYQNEAINGLTRHNEEFVQTFRKLHKELSAVTSERDKYKSELNKWEDWPKEYDVLKEMRIQSDQNSLACKQAYINALEFELKHNILKVVELEAQLAEANKDAHRLYGCINCIQANPQEALELHRARLAKETHDR